MPALLTLYPALESMAVQRRGDILTFATPAGRCHFLDGGNLCRIEKEHGKALKPGVCTLFPFNVFTRIGKAVAVSPHFMCPLRLQVPARPGQVEGTHAVLETAVRESALLDSAYLDVHTPPVRLHPSENAESVLTRESNFRDLCSVSLGQRSFTEFMLEYQLAKFLRLDLRTAPQSSGVANRLTQRRVERAGIDLIFFFSY